MANIAAKVACFHTSTLKKPNRSAVNEYKLSRALIVNDLRRTTCTISESAFFDEGIFNVLQLVGDAEEESESATNGGRVKGK
jgi:hypothetical protein